mgnify:CR=1 FL=1
MGAGAAGKILSSILTFNPLIVFVVGVYQEYVSTVGNWHWTLGDLDLC